MHMVFLRLCGRSPSICFVYREDHSVLPDGDLVTEALSKGFSPQNQDLTSNYKVRSTMNIARQAKLYNSLS